MKKTWWAIPFVLALIAILGVIYLINDSPDVTPLSFRIGSDQDAETINAWYDGENICYVFLPSYADLRSVSAEVPPKYTINVGGIPLDDNTDLRLFVPGKTYRMQISGRHHHTECQFRLLQSADVAAMYINTQSGSMKHIHKLKNDKETVQVTLFDEEGVQTDYGIENKLNGRGQSTWLQEKKPYLLTLSAPQSLLSMNPAEKWVLLSNAYDPTNLRNKLTFDLSREIGLAWTPDCRYVDLYLNGDYAGLYLLSEKVEANSSRLDILSEGNTDNINFLCKNEILTRWSSMHNPFLTDFGRAIEITSPATISRSQNQQIADEVQLMENVILSEDDQLLDQYLDLDSWAKKYLIDEISANVDADTASSYFYCVHNGDSPVFYAGPVWDYDLTFGNLKNRNTNPRALYANSKYEEKSQPTPYFHSLYRKERFKNLVITHYEHVFLPCLTALLDTGIDELAASIFDASYMNQIRWSRQDDEISGEQIKAYLKERIDFLNEVWLDGAEYYTVQIEPNDKNSFSPFISFAVKPGEILSERPDFISFVSSNRIWCDFETGLPFDFSQPITRDIVLIKGKTKSSQKPSILSRIKNNKTIVITLASVALIGLIFVVLIWYDCKKYKLKRKTDAETVK